MLLCAFAIICKQYYTPKIIEILIKYRVEIVKKTRGSAGARPPLGLRPRPETEAQNALSKSKHFASAVFAGWPIRVVSLRLQISTISTFFIESIKHFTTALFLDVVACDHTKLVQAC